MTTQRAVEFTRSATVREAPAEVEVHVKDRIFDTIAAITAGYRQKGVNIVRDYATTRLSEGNTEVSASVLDGSGTTLSAEGATLSNSVAANALDIDDGHREVKGHPAAVVVPPALAAAEVTESSVQELLDAVYVGYEVAVRAGLAIHGVDEVYTGTGSWGAVGAAAAVARLYELTDEQTAHALGIAEYHAPRTPIMRGVEKPGMTKDGIGWGAYAGIAATQLAKSGFTGSGTVFDDAEYLNTVGEEFHVTNGYLKPYPCCRWAQPGIEAILTLTSKHDIDPQTVESIRVKTFEEATHLQIRTPETPEEAQYSYPYPVAAALAHGQFTQAEHAAEVRSNPTVLTLARRVELSIDEALDTRFPSECLARVEVRTTGGRYTSDITDARGAHNSPLSDEVKYQKAKRLISPTLSQTVVKHTEEHLNTETTLVTTLLEPW